jgi:hypothetical protein
VLRESQDGKNLFAKRTQFGSTLRANFKNTFPKRTQFENRMVAQIRAGLRLAEYAGAAFCNFVIDPSAPRHTAEKYWNR